eukprot:775193-Pleurochrysis_carterae.AAC.1
MCAAAAGQRASRLSTHAMSNASFPEELCAGFPDHSGPGPACGDTRDHGGDGSDESDAVMLEAESMARCAQL